MPDFLAIVVITIETCGAEPRDHPLAISDRGRGTGRIIRRISSFLFQPRDSGLPKQIPMAPVKAKNGAAVLLFNCLRDEDPLAPDDRRRISPVWQRGFPGNICVGAPMNWGDLFAGDSRATGASPGRPVISPRFKRRKKY